MILTNLLATIKAIVKMMAMAVVALVVVGVIGWLVVQVMELGMVIVEPAQFT